MAVEIPLTRGLVAIVDDDDTEWLNKWKWHASVNPEGSYALRNQHPGGVRSLIFMHREICPPPAGFQVDHINGNRLDNRRCNLRVATISQNNANRPVYKNNQLGVKGVALSGGKYRARIRVNRKCICLGRHETIEQAAEAYRLAAERYFGEFARLA